MQRHCTCPADARMMEPPLRRARPSQAYVKLFTCVRSASVQLYERDLDVAWGLSDHHKSIRAAYTSVWPGISSLSCYPHVSRNIYAKAPEELKDSVSSMVGTLHRCISLEQFNALTPIVCKQLSDAGAR